jgi:putative tricarboxylic transport membrane protein
MSSASPIINVVGRKIAVDIPHLVFATGIAGWIAWFCWDAWRASSSIENLILIVPVSAIAIVLYLFVAAGCFQPVAECGEQRASPRHPLAPGVGLKVAGSMALLIALVVAGPLVGFDIACFVYMLAMLAFLGERRIAILLLIPPLFSVVVIYCFSTLLSTPLPLFFFGERG